MRVDEHSLPPWCDAETAATYLDVSKWLVYDLCRSGQLRSVKLGRLLRIPRSALLTFGEEEQEIARPGLQADGRAIEAGSLESRHAR